MIFCWDCCWGKAMVVDAGSSRGASVSEDCFGLKLQTEEKRSRHSVPTHDPWEVCLIEVCLYDFLWWNIFMYRYININMYVHIYIYIYIYIDTHRELYIYICNCLFYFLKIQLWIFNGDERHFWTQPAGDTKVQHSEGQGGTSGSSGILTAFLYMCFSFQRVVKESRYHICKLSKQLNK